MDDSNQEDILRQVTEMRRDLDSLMQRFADMEKRIEAQAGQLESTAQHGLAQDTSKFAPPVESRSTTTIQTGGRLPSSLPAGTWEDEAVTGTRKKGTQDEGVQSERAQSEGAQSAGPQSPSVQDKGAQSAGPQSPSVQDKGAQSAGPQSPSVQDKGAQDEGAQSAGAQTAGAQVKGIQSEKIQSAGIQAEKSRSARHPSPGTQVEGVGAAESPAGGARASSQGLETRIGSLWLNRLGVAVLLVGFVSLLLYSFQYCGPAVRVACGALIAALVVWFSHRRSTAQLQHKVFFEGLNALGWSLGYFVAYGMYFIEPLKVNPSLMLELPLLLATAAGGMADAVAFNSEATAVLSSSFAYLGLILCVGSIDPGLFNLGFLVTGAALTYVSIRKNWHAALLVCCFSFFGSVHYCNFASREIFSSQSTTASAVPSLFLNLSLVAGWLIFNSAIWVLKEIPLERRWAVLGTSLVSAFCFPQLLNHAIHLQQPEWEVSTAHAWVYGCTGMFYMLTARFFKKGLKSDDLWSLHYLIGLSLLNTSRWLKLAGYSESGLIADLCEIALLTALGLRFNIPMFRYFAAFWSLIAVTYWGNNPALMLCGILACGLCAHLYTRADSSAVQSAFERKVFGPWYYVLANIFGLHMIFGSFLQEWQFTAVVIQASINAILSLKLRWKTCTAVAATILFCFATGLFLLTDATQSALSAVVSFAVYFYCRDAYLKNMGRLEKFWKIVYAIFANITVFGAVCAHVPANFISAVWGLHGLILIAIGFRLLEKTFRIFALSLFALVTLRLLFFDLASAPTIERIISFIIAGGVFVGCSYVYTWFSKYILEAGKADSESE